jgi:PRTRC genetic system protein E
MNFFQQLNQQPDIDLVLRIFKKDNTITIGVLPGSSESNTRPINISGSAEELDAEFFETILPKVNEVKGIISNIDAVKKDIEDEAVAAEPKKEIKSSSVKNVMPKKEEKKTAEPNLFLEDK